MHLDNLIFILLIAFAALFRLLVNKAGNQPNKQPPRTTSQPRTTNQPRPSADSDEERIRRFLEALGQPTSSTPPPPVTPRTSERPTPTTLPHVGPMRSPLPPLTTRPPDLPRQAPPVLPVKPAMAKPPPIPAAIAQPVTFEVQAAAPLISAATRESTDDLADLLRSTSGLRNAIVLREVFGPPRGLQQFDLIGN